MKLVFLDFDGVINTRTWSERNKKICFLSEEDGKVGDFQAICWLNELCKKTDAKIVLTTIWRINNSLSSLKKILYNSGLNKDIEIVGCTPIHANRFRKEEIEEYLSEHKDLNILNYVILDDEEIFGHEEHMVKCNIDYGFKFPEFQKALIILNN